MTPSRPGTTTRGAALVTVLGVVVVLLWRLGEGTLAAPSLESWAAVQRWYVEAGPEVATMALVRLLALLVAAWLLLGASLELVAVVASGSEPGPRSRGVVGRLADLIAPRSLQRLVHGLAGLSLTAGLAVVAPSAGIPAGSGPGVAVMHVVEEPPTQQTSPTGTATMRRIEDVAPPATPVAVAAVAPAAAVPEEVVVAPGESFWSISSDALTEALGRTPQDLEITAHWRRLVAANRDRLVDPANPDLLYPGQTLVLPAP